jgi:hypothetical protein
MCVWIITIYDIYGVDMYTIRMSVCEYEFICLFLCLCVLAC